MAILYPGRTDIWHFARESNAIEGIRLERRHDQHTNALETFIRGELTMANLEAFVEQIETGARLRAMPGLDVRVGSHYPPPGGGVIPAMLQSLLQKAVDGMDPFLVHQLYESLHPFTDGNGRSGRAVWLWQMLHQHDWRMKLGFLHWWYYRTLEYLRDEWEDFERTAGKEPAP